MTSVITGDIIKSGNYTNPEVWLTPLKAALTKSAGNFNYWEIFRGDSFQIETGNTFDSFMTATYIKAYIKTVRGLDVRMAIGIGGKIFEGDRVTESNGEAFQFSGYTLENLKKEKVNLKVKTSNIEFDNELNLYFKLLLISMDDWTVNSAEIVKLFIEHPEKTQKELAKMIGISQDAVSKRLKRAHIDLILDVDTMFRQKLKEKL